MEFSTENFIKKIEFNLFELNDFQKVVIGDIVIEGTITEGDPLTDMDVDQIIFEVSKLLKVGELTIKKILWEFFEEEEQTE